MTNAIGSRVKALRVQNHLTAAQLGYKCGIGENAVYKIEAGDTKMPSFTTGVRLAKVLGVEPYYIAFGAEVAKRQAPAYETEGPSTAEVSRIAEVLAMVLGRVNAIEAQQTAPASLTARGRGR